MSTVETTNSTSTEDTGTSPPPGEGLGQFFNDAIHAAGDAIDTALVSIGVKSETPAPGNTSGHVAQERQQGSLESRTEHFLKENYDNLANSLSIEIPFINKSLNEIGKRQDEVNVNVLFSGDTNKRILTDASFPGQPRDTVTYTGGENINNDEKSKIDEDGKHVTGNNDDFINALKAEVAENGGKPLNKISLLSHGSPGALLFPPGADGSNGDGVISVKYLLDNLVEEGIIADGSQIDILGCSAAGTPDAQADLARLAQENNVTITAYDGISYGHITTRATANKVVFTPDNVSNPIINNGNPVETDDFIKEMLSYSSENNTGS